MKNDKPEKIVFVSFWADTNGGEPVREWLLSLTKIQRQIVGCDIKTVEFGWPLGMPLVKNLGNRIWEVRSNFREGIARVLFTMDKNKIVLLHGFVKKTQKRPAKDLQTAIKRAKSLR